MPPLARWSRGLAAREDRTVATSSRTLTTLESVKKKKRDRTRQPSVTRGRIDSRYLHMHELLRAVVLRYTRAHRQLVHVHELSRKDQFVCSSSKGCEHGHTLALTPSKTKNGRRHYCTVVTAVCMQRVSRNGPVISSCHQVKLWKVADVFVFRAASAQPETIQERSHIRFAHGAGPLPFLLKINRCGSHVAQMLNEQSTTGSAIPRS